MLSFLSLNIDYIDQSIMHIAIVRQKYTPFGGAERFVSNAISHLAQHKKGHTDVTLISRHWQDDNLTNTTFNLICVSPHYFPKTSLIRDKSFAKAVQSIIKHQHFDIVQTHERIPGCDIFRAGDGVHATWLEQRAKVASSVQKIGFRLSPFHRYQLKTEQALFTHPHLRYVICNSKMVQTDIMNRFGLPEKKLPVIYNGYDPARFSMNIRLEHRDAERRHLNIPDDAPVFLFVGSGFERKGLRQAICAVATQQTAYLIIVGHDKHSRHYQQLAARLLSDRAIFIGSSKDVRPYYAAADAFILPTLYDPFPNVIFEAMAMGLPVITTNACGGMDFINNDQQGFICDCTDLAAFNQAVACLSDLAYAKKLGQNAFDAVKDLTFDQMTLKLCELYQSIIDTKQ